MVLRPHLTLHAKPMYIAHKGKLLTTLQLMKLELAGKIPSPMSHSLMAKQVNYVEHHKRPFFRGITPDKSQSVAEWSSLLDYDYLLGQSKKMTSTVGAIDTANNTCYEPYMVKVDHNQNIWTGCDEVPPDYYSGVQEYTSAGALTATYGSECPSPPAGYISCDYYYGYGYDSAENSSNVFISLEFFEAEFCTSGGSCGYDEGGGFMYWPAGEPSDTPSLIGGADCNPLCDVYYMDVDASGNLWFDYYGEVNDEYGYGVAEIQNPTSSTPTFVSALNPGTMECAGGVYVSTKSGTQTVNALDCSSRKIYQFTTEGVETGTLGPVDLFGEPYGLGFNSTDTSAVNADCELDWNNVGNLAKNTWSPKKSAYEVSCLYGSAYTPSDK
ncbi:MAG TPA: hypothetical protein VKR56_10275 [Candidatus Cybelea sp.]|nr:hypothetical protein [Candidatus Cybelea sp.]